MVPDLHGLVWSTCVISFSFAGPDAVSAVLYVGMMRVHMTFVTTVGLPLDSVTPPQSSLACVLWH
jgi:hypothetical protein